MSIGYGNRRRRFGSEQPFDASSSTGSTGGMGSLPQVDDPEKTFSDITRQEYLDYVNNFQDFELDLLEKAQTDTSLIDSAREDSAIAGQIAEGIAGRNLRRYGGQLTPAQQREQSRGLQRSNTLGSIQALSDARIAQREANQNLMFDLINIGQGVRRSAQDQLGSAAGDASARRQAFERAKAQSKAQTYSTLGTLGAAAMIAFI